MRKFKRTVLLLALLALTVGAVFLFSSCGTKYNIRYDYPILHLSDGSNGIVYDEQYTLSVDTAEGNVLNVREYDKEHFHPKPGYTFGGYQTKDGLKVFDADLKQVPGVPLTKDMVELVPIWIPMTYTVIFAEDEIDGKLYVNSEKSFEILSGEVLEPERFYTPELTVPNTEFLGWKAETKFINSDYEPEERRRLEIDDDYSNYGYFAHVGSYVDQNGVTHEGNFVLFKAKIDYIQHTVTLSYRDGTPKVFINVINGEPLPDLSEYDIKKNGQHVRGFSTEMYEYVPFFGNVTESMTLYAQYESYNSVTLRYSDTESKVFDIYENDPVELPVPEDTENYIFGGWYGNKEYTGPIYRKPTLSDTPSTYHAKWIPKNYALTFDVNGGKALAPDSYAYGMEDTLPIPEKEHCKFLGWCIEPELTVPFFKMPSEVSGELTLYAKWEECIPISTKDELYAIAENPGDGYYLTNDINLEGDTWTPIQNFSGTLQGDGFAIKNFSLKVTDGADACAFIIENHGIITDLTFTDMSLGYYNVKHAGVIVSRNYGTLDNCHVITKDLDSSACALQYNYRHTTHKDETITHVLRVGAIAAYNAPGASITGCTASTPIKISYYASNIGDGSSGTLNMYLYCAEICGQNDGNISDCSSQREISLSGSTTSNNGMYNGMSFKLRIHNFFLLGGIVGANEESGVIERSCASTALSSTVSYSGNDVGRIYASVGGVAGYNGGIIERSFSDGAEISGAYVHNSHDRTGIGGVVGRNAGTGKVSDCYSKDFISTARDVVTGGFVGTNSGIVQTSYVLDASLRVEITTNTWFIGGFAGYNHTTATIRNCISKVTLDLPADIAYCRQFAGDTVGIMVSCFVSDEGKLIISGTEGEAHPDTNATLKADAELFTAEFLVDELYWNDEVWKIDGVNPPIFKD